MKGIRSIVLLLVMGCLQSCVYQSDLLSFLDIKKPENSVPSKITLSSEKDSVIIFGPTMFTYNVETYGKIFNAAEVEVLDTKNTYTVTKDSFSINPAPKDSTWFDLKISFYMCSGSGSIADKLKAENYLGSKTWKIKYLNLRTFDYRFQHHITADSLIEVFWVKPHVVPSTIGSVSIGNTLLTSTRISGDTLFYRDPHYCGGPLNYSLNVNVYRNEYVGFGTNVNYPYPEFKFTYIGFDSCLVSWTPSPIRRYYKLSDKYAGFGNSFKDLALPGVSISYNLYTYPSNYTSTTSYSSYIWTTKVNGVKADYQWAYSNVKDKFVLSKAIANYPGLIWSDYTLPPYDRTVDGFGLEYSLCGNNDGTHYIGILNDVLHVFDENLADIRQITLESKPESVIYYYLQVTDNGCFASFNSYRELTIYNIGSDPTWQKFIFKPDYSDSSMLTYAMAMTSLTADGRYAACCSEKKLYIYDVSDHQNAKVIFSAPRTQAYNVLANQLNKDELIVTSKDKIEIRTCPGFQLKKQLVLTGIGDINIMNLDSYSNILLVSSTTCYHFINLDTMKEVFRFTLGGNPYYGYGARLYRNQLFVGSTKTDMTPYLK